MGRFSLKRLPSPGLTVGVVALVAALSGTAVALPGKNTVDSGDLKRGAVKTSDIARGAVTNSKVRNRTLTRAKLRNGTITGGKVSADTLTGANINESTLGQVPSANTANSATTASSVAANGVNTAAIENGAVTSPKIAADAVGARELKGTYAAVSGGTPAAANVFVNATATCNAGDVVLGGGFAWAADADEIETVYSTPDPLTNPNTWIVRSRSGVANTLFAWALCLAA